MVRTKYDRDDHVPEMFKSTERWGLVGVGVHPVSYYNTYIVKVTYVIMITSALNLVQWQVYKQGLCRFDL